MGLWGTTENKGGQSVFHSGAVTWTDQRKSDQLILHSYKSLLQNIFSRAFPNLNFIPLCLVCLCLNMALNEDAGIRSDEGTTSPPTGEGLYSFAF